MSSCIYIHTDRSMLRLWVQRFETAASLKIKTYDDDVLVFIPSSCMERLTRAVDAFNAEWSRPALPVAEDHLEPVS